MAAAGSVYLSALRAKLSPLGLRWAVRTNGLGEVADVDRRLLRAFSTQGRRIEADLAERGFTSPAAANVAAPSGPSSQNRDVASAPDEALHARWRAQLEAVELDDRRARVADVTDALGRDETGPTGPPELADSLAVMASGLESAAQ